MATHYLATPVQSSPTRFKTKDGIMISKDAVLWMSGELPYTRQEAGLAGDGVVKVLRSRREALSPRTLASAEGKPIVIGIHQFIDPANFCSFAVGHAQNVRQGRDIGKEASVIGDLFVADANAIRQIEQGQIREISIGFDCNFAKGEGGRIFQTDIEVNHVCILRRGRGGKNVAIGDSSEDTDEKLLKVETMMDELVRAGDALPFRSDRAGTSLDRLAQELRDDIDCDGGAYGAAMAAYLGKHVAQGQRDFREREVEEHIDSSRHAQDADDQDAEAAASFEAMCANSLREMQR